MLQAIAQTVSANKTVASGLTNSISNLNTLFTWVTNLLIIIGVFLVLVFLATGFIKYITSQGDKTAVEQAQKWVTFAAVGGIGLFLVFAAKNIIFSLVGANETDFNNV